MKLPITCAAIVLSLNSLAQPCFENNLCSSAIDLGVITTVPMDVDSGIVVDPFTCIEGCNLSADPYEEEASAPCLNPNTPVVWYSFRTDFNASLANISVSSEDFESPAFQLFWADQGDCTGLFQVDECYFAAGGQVTATGIELGGDATYYLAVGAVNSTGGDFEVCISILEEITNCVISSEIEVTARSEGGPLEGPFLPGEIVSICMNITDYTAIGNNCQWLQGVIPSFGKGWDPISFNEDWMPVMNTTVHGQSAVDDAGNAIPVSGIYTGQWSWFNDVTYHHDNSWYNVGDFDGNGSLEICHALFDPDCMGPGLTGGCCANCWQDEPGTLLPPGWYTYGTTGNCPSNGHPTVDWGDGSGCGNMSGPWIFCFDLKVREYPDCAQDPSTMDLSIGMVTTADGETGAWSGGPSVCANDVPLALDFSGCCVELEDLGTQTAEICSGDALDVVLEASGISFWEVDVLETDGVEGATAGGVNNGEKLPDVLTLAGSNEGTVTYRAFGYAGVCPDVSITIEVVVNPQPEAGFTANIFGSTAIFSNQTVNSSSVLWEFGDGSSSTLTDPIHQFEVAGTYTVILTAVNACGIDSFAQSVFISGPVISQYPIDTIKIFPNPNNGNFVIEVDEIWKELTTYEIIGMDGRRISHGRLTGRSNEIELGDQAGPGVYQLIVRNGAETHLERVVITPD